MDKFRSLCHSDFGSAPLSLKDNATSSPVAVASSFDSKEAVHPSSPILPLTSSPTLPLDSLPVGPLKSSSTLPHAPTLQSSLTPPPADEWTNIAIAAVVILAVVGVLVIVTVALDVIMAMGVIVVRRRMKDTTS